MTAGAELLLLAAIPLLVTCQQKPTVSLPPGLTQIFTGDLFHLRCKGGSDDATWHFNDTPHGSDKTLKIFATSKNSGRYRCESGGQRSDDLSIKVHEFVPVASLRIRTGQPVMRRKGRVVLELQHDDGLRGWSCIVHRGENTSRVTLRMGNKNLTSFAFETYPLLVPETIYWCVQGANYRSNQVILRTTEKEVTLEAYPFPAISGDGLTLTCLVWGTDEISNSVFYKDNQVYTNVKGPTCKIRSVTESDVGRYKCVATYRHKAQTIRASHIYDSDEQDMLVQARPVRPQLLSNNMECSCPSCYGNMSYRFYKKIDDYWRPLPLNEKPSLYGTYHCRYIMDYMRTLPSNAELSEGPGPSKLKGIGIGILVAIVLLCLLLCVLKYYNKRKAQVDIYEQVAMKSPEERHYDALNVAQVREGEYDTLQPGAEGREKTGGEYEPLKQGTKEEVYHTLGDNVASGSGEGGYEALKREGIQKDEYDTLKTKEAERKPGAGNEGGDGGYEALKKDGIQKDEYETLKMKQAEKKPGAGNEGGDGGYEALKKEGIQKDEYETLKTKQAEKKPGAES